MPVENPEMHPPSVSVPAARGFETTPALRGNIYHEVNPIAVLTPINSAQMRFNVDHMPFIPIAGIYVANGDVVSEGDIIASLDFPDIGDEYDSLSRRLAIIDFEMQIQMERHDLMVRLASQAGERIRETPYIIAHNNLKAEREIVEALVEYVQSAYEERLLRASMSGVVSGVMRFSEGMMSDSRMVIAVISDQLVSSFRVRGEFAGLMKPGDLVYITMAEDVFQMEVLDPELSGFLAQDAAQTGGADGDPEPVAHLWFTDEPESFTGTTGTVRLLIGEIHDVVYIPVSALNRTDFRTYVYVMADGVRQVRDVVTGFESGEYIEIISGLEEGELLVI